MINISTVSEWQKIRSQFPVDKFVGFVPTMGALHSGHLSLVKSSKEQNDITVVSIFVNPTQFNSSDDLKDYPNTLGEDIKRLEELGVDYVFLPAKDDIYPDKYNYQLTETSLSRRLEGKHRPGHFDGVLTIVMKLFHLVGPNRSYFGEKDFQQLELIKGMVAAFFMDIEIVTGPTVRETDGLAMSSRNLNLDLGSRELAPRFFDALKNSTSAQQAKQKLTSEGFKVDYVEDWSGRRLGAVHLNDVRLIDNVEV